MRRFYRVLLLLLLFPPLLALVGGWLAAPAFLHPVRRPLTPDLIREADASFVHVGAHREDFDVHASDGVLLRGWKVRAAQPNGSWVLAFHGVADNRVGILSQSELLLRAGYNVVMMDSRAHGESEGPIATYGWLERNDTRAILDSLVSTEHPLHIYALGESMGAGIALQSAAADPRIEAVVAEASFASLREASYDYAGLQQYPLIGQNCFCTRGLDDALSRPILGWLSCCPGFSRTGRGFPRISCLAHLRYCRHHSSLPALAPNLCCSTWPQILVGCAWRVSYRSLRLSTGRVPAPRLEFLRDPFLHPVACVSPLCVSTTSRSPMGALYAK